MEAVRVENSHLEAGDGSADLVRKAEREAVGQAHHIDRGHVITLTRATASGDLTASLAIPQCKVCARL